MVSLYTQIFSRVELNLKKKREESNGISLFENLDLTYCKSVICGESKGKDNGNPYLSCENIYGKECLLQVIIKLIIFSMMPIIFFDLT